MAKKELLDLADRLEAAPDLDGDLAEAAVRGLREAFPGQARAGLIPDGISGSSDLLEALVLSALPGWHFSIHGRARPAGPWTCSLRRSDVGDDDEVLGTGEARCLSRAILAAVLRVAARQ